MTTLTHLRELLAAAEHRIAVFSCKHCHLPACSEPDLVNATMEALPALLRVAEAAKVAAVLLEHGDFKNGVEHLGTDEGAVKAYEMLLEIRRAIAALEGGAHE